MAYIVDYAITEPAPGGATAETKTSKHTKKYHELYGDKEK